MRRIGDSGKRAYKETGGPAWAAASGGGSEFGVEGLDRAAHLEAGPAQDAIAAHHEDVPPKSVLAVLVQAADSLSGARPGARKELLESYVKRLEELEGIATGFSGVSRAFAIQAGREVRVMVDCDSVNDDQIFLLSKDIAKQIEEKMTYPGQIRVTVIREKRAVGIAK